MSKLIASINMTLDGYCDHTVGIVTEELHEYFNRQLRNAGALIYGRTTYQLMEDAWPAMVKNPTGNKAMDDFAVLIDNITKVVFSRTLKNLTWKNSTLAQQNLTDEILQLKQQPGKELLVGSPSLIAQLTQLNLIDEYRLCVHPIIAGNGLVLFSNITNKITLKLIKTETFKSGVVVLYYNTSI